jgi:3-hydroxyisobutyrate dehydrogenase
MARNLLKKTSQETKLYVFDVVKDALKQLVEEGNGRVEACKSSKDVADKSVCVTSRVQ